MDKRTTRGLLLTAAWLGTALGFVYAKWDTVPSMALNSWGDYLAGVFSPIAFLWLVIGYFQQGEELRHNTVALELQASELKKSVAEQAALVEATKKQVELMDLAQKEQRQQEIRRAQLKLRYAGGSSGGGRNGMEATVRLRNVGHSVTEVEVKCNSALIQCAPVYYQYLDNNQELELKLSYPFVEAEGESNYLSFTYIDGRGAPSEHLLFIKIKDQRPAIFYQPQENDKPTSMHTSETRAQPLVDIP